MLDQPERIEPPDRFGRTALIALGLWGSLGLAVWLAFALMFPGRGGPNTPTPSIASPEVAKREPAEPTGIDKAREIFSQRCVACHGPSGRGDGPASASLTPKPRQFSDAAWQASVSDAHIENVIKYGGGAVGKSAAMPSNPDLQSNAELIADLRTVVRGFKP